MAGQVRQWQFWRGGFWKRPVLVVPLGLLLFLVALGLAASIPGAVSAGRAAEDDHVCQGGVTEDCVAEVRGTLDGPHHSRGPGSTWWFTPKGAEETLDLDASTATSRRLDPYAGDEVTAYVWEDDEVAAVLLPDGGRAMPQEVGVRGAVYLGTISLFALTMGLMLFGYGWGSWRRTGSWFAVNGHGWGDSTLAMTCFVGSVIAFVPLLLGGIPLFVGAPIWVVQGCVAVGVLLLAAAVVKNGIPRPGRR